MVDPQRVEADGISRAGGRYGFCSQTCPTQVLLGDENDAPRGRIDLIRTLLEPGGALLRAGLLVRGVEQTVCVTGRDFATQPADPVVADSRRV